MAPGTTTTPTDGRLASAPRPVHARIPWAPPPRSRATDVRFAVRLTPRAALDRVDGVLDGVLKARVTAPAVEGAANNALVRLLSDELGIARRDVRIVAGASSREKLVVVDGVEAEAVIARWPGLRV
jgi:uncharacterized protein YggU (UPF0235/DUF167 family)